MPCMQSVMPCMQSVMPCRGICSSVHLILLFDSLNHKFVSNVMERKEVPDLLADDNKVVVQTTTSTLADGSTVKVSKSLLQGKPFDEKGGPTETKTVTDAQGMLLRQDLTWENSRGKAHRDGDKPAMMRLRKSGDDWVVFLMWYKDGDLSRTDGLPESYNSFHDEWDVWIPERGVLKLGVYPDAEGKIHGLTRQEAITQWVEPHLPAPWKALGLCVEAKAHSSGGGRRRTAGSKR